MPRKNIKQGEISQTNRLIIIYKALLEGKRFTAKELIEFVNNEIAETSERTIYRDINTLQEIDDRIVKKKIGKESVFYIPHNELSFYHNNIFNVNDALSIHVLKENLKFFKGTVIDESINDLLEKLEAYAPGNIFMNSNIFWDKNVGIYDYSDYYITIKCLTRTIAEKKWIDVSYIKLSDNKEKYYLLFPYGLFTYNGALYLAAYYPKRRTYLTLAVHGIVDIRESEEQNKRVPEFDLEKFEKDRFGVFSGELKKVKLKILPQFVKYFEKRTWHSSQKEYYAEDKSLILEFEVPLTIDFISWIVSWQHAIIVLEPSELKQEIKKSLLKTLEYYN